MTALWLLPVYVSTLLIAAHFLRSGSMILTSICCAISLLLLIPRCWTARIMQIFLVIASLEWCRALYVLVQQRIAEGLPWLRLGIILGSVVILTVASVFVFKAERLRARYKL